MHMQLQISVFWHLVITEYFQQQYYWYYIVSVSKCIRIWDALRSEIMSQNDKVPSWDQWVVGYILCSMYKCIYCGGLLLVFFYLFHIKSHQIFGQILNFGWAYFQKIIHSFYHALTFKQFQFYFYSALNSAATENYNSFNEFRGKC